MLLSIIKEPTNEKHAVPAFATCDLAQAPANPRDANETPNQGIIDRLLESFGWDHGRQVDKRSSDRRNRYPVKDLYIHRFETIAMHDCRSAPAAVARYGQLDDLPLEPSKVPERPCGAV